MDEALQAAIREYEAGQFEEATKRLRELLLVQPHNSAAVHYFGLAAHALGQHADALKMLRTAVSISPGAPEYLVSLGDVHYHIGETAAAIAAWQQALTCQTQNGPAHQRLGRVYGEMGDLPCALEHLRRALDVNPDQPAVRSTLLYLLQHDPMADDFTLYEEHVEYSHVHAAPLAGSIQPYTQEFTPDRPIRVGYLCPDFHAPAIACFIAPILKFHRSPQCQIVLYSDAPSNGGRQPHASPHLSHSISTLDDRQVADLIRRDQIDILVDLAVHSPGNRMLVLAQKPAPVQAAYLPYPGATGLATVFYRLTDMLLDPHGAHRDFRMENLVRLPTGYVSYLPPSDTSVSALPPPPIRLACCCRLAQLNPQVLQAWAQILARVPEARLCLEAPGLGDPVMAAALRQRCGAANIPEDRLELQPFVDPATSLQRLGQCHIALDPFPFNTTTTACDALWMGLPLITLGGRTAPARVGLSLLTHLAQPETIAPTPEAYVQTAVALAGDTERLTARRATLRQAMLDAALTDGARFTRNLEAAYHEMWKRRCAEALPPAP